MIAPCLFKALSVEPLELPNLVVIVPPFTQRNLVLKTADICLIPHQKATNVKLEVSSINDSEFYMTTITN